MFGLESLGTLGHTYENSEPMRRGVHFLLAHRMADGGWGESIEVSRLSGQSQSVRKLMLSFGQSCRTGRYSHSDKSRVVNTSWVIIALVRSRFPDKNVIRSAVNLIISRQRPDGHWERVCMTPTFIYVDVHGSTSLCVRRRKEQREPSTPVRVEFGLATEPPKLTRVPFEGCILNYPNFLFSFTIWALGVAAKYLEE